MNMGKRYGIENKPSVVLQEVICDKCGADCKNSHFDILLKMSFNDEPNLLKTLCYKCYKKEYTIKEQSKEGVKR